MFGGSKAKSAAPKPKAPKGSGQAKPTRVPAPLPKPKATAGGQKAAPVGAQSPDQQPAKVGDAAASYAQATPTGVASAKPTASPAAADCPGAGGKAQPDPVDQSGGQGSATQDAKAKFDAYNDGVATLKPSDSSFYRRMAAMVGDVDPNLRYPIRVEPLATPPAPHPGASLGDQADGAEINASPRSYFACPCCARLFHVFIDEAGQYCAVVATGMENRKVAMQAATPASPGSTARAPMSPTTPGPV